MPYEVEWEDGIGPMDYDSSVGFHMPRVLRKGVEQMCTHCRKPGAERKCSGCMFAWYCDRDCQKAAWKGHKPLCEVFKRAKGIGDKARAAEPDFNMTFKKKANFKQREMLCRLADVCQASASDEAVSDVVTESANAPQYKYVTVSLATCT